MVISIKVTCIKTSYLDNLGSRLMWAKRAGQLCPHYAESTVVHSTGQEKGTIRDIKIFDVQLPFT